ncbi:MAG TPA: ferredoxin reductase [Gemmatimonadaceae bacterium]
MTPARLEWQVANVADVRAETDRTRTLVLRVPAWSGHRAGQHLDVRLVSEDGYRAERSYSIASAPEAAAVELTIERLEDGEVSPYLCDVLQPGDGLEVRGPIGGYFVWTTMQPGPLLLVAGGSGIVPLMAMLRHRTHADAKARANVPVRLLYSARTWMDVIYKDELEKLKSDADVSIAFALTRESSADASGFRRRVDRAMLEEAAWPASDMPNVFVCGPTPFTESVASLLVELGHAPANVRTERFGPTG